MAFAVTAVAVDGLASLAVALTAALLAAVSARLPFAATCKRVLSMDLFIVFTLVMLPFTVPGEPIARFGALTATREGLWQAMTIALKANAVVLAVLTLIGTMEAITFGHALSRLRVPSKLVQLLLFTARYIEVLSSEYGRLREAMRARAFRPRGNMHTWRSIGYLTGMLLARSFECAERILAAMKCRGYIGRLHVLDRLALRPTDVVFACGCAVLMATILWLDHL